MISEGWKVEPEEKGSVRQRHTIHVSMPMHMHAETATLRDIFHVVFQMSVTKDNIQHTSNVIQH
jgi:hypothetical protein